MLDVLVRLLVVRRRTLLILLVLQQLVHSVLVMRVERLLLVFWCGAVRTVVRGLRGVLDFKHHLIGIVLPFVVVVVVVCRDGLHVQRLLRRLNIVLLFVL